MKNPRGSGENEYGGCSFSLPNMFACIWIQNMFKRNTLVLFGFCFFLFPFLRSNWMFSKARFYTNPIPFRHPPLIISFVCGATCLLSMRNTISSRATLGELAYDPTVLTYPLTMNSLLLANMMLAVLYS